MDPIQKRRLTRAIGTLLDRSEEVFDTGNGQLKTLKISGDGWQAYIYAPSGPGTETIHVEVKVATLAAAA